MNLEIHDEEQIDACISNWQKQLDATTRTSKNVDEISQCEILMGTLPSSWMNLVSIHTKDKEIKAEPG